MSENSLTIENFIARVKRVKKIVAVFIKVYFSSMFIYALLMYFFKMKFNVNLILAAVSIYGFALVIYVLWARFLICPKCNEKFIGKFPGGNLWIDKCMNCGLKL